MSPIQYTPPNATFQMPPLSAAARIGDLVFVSGTPGYYPDGHIDEGDFGAQFDQRCERSWSEPARRCVRWSRSTCC
jgi:2-iminobutanoate/2-iminopropanoate deaminase